MIQLLESGHDFAGALVVGTDERVVRAGPAVVDPTPAGALVWSNDGAPVVNAVAMAWSRLERQGESNVQLKWALSFD